MIQHPSPQPQTHTQPVAAAPQAYQQQPVAATPQNVPTGGFTWLQQGEQVKLKVDGILGFSSPNPLLRMFMSIMIALMAIIGFRNKASLIVTDRRVVLDTRAYSLWILEKGSDTTTIVKATNITTGYNSSLFIFKKRYISIDSIEIGTKRNFTQSDLETMSHLIEQVL
mgnify:FL=1